MSESGTLNTFLQTFKNGFVHPNLFKATFSAIPSLSKYMEKLSSACKSAQIPGITFTEASYYHDGYTHKFVSGADYDPFPMTFIVDGGSESDVIKCFDEWNELIYKDGQFGFKEDYEATLDIEMYNRDQSVLYKTKMIGVYPTNITSFDLNWDTKTTVMEYEISFNFHRFD